MTIWLLQRGDIFTMNWDALVSLRPQEFDENKHKQEFACGNRCCANRPPEQRSLVCSTVRPLQDQPHSKTT